MRRECLGLGVMLLVAGLFKAADPGHFQAMLARYGLVPTGLLPYAAPLFIGAEILLAVALLSGRSPKQCLEICELLFYGFSVALASVLARGLQIRCACFGVFSLKVSPLHVLVCLCLALYLSWRRCRPEASLRDTDLIGLSR